MTQLYGWLATATLVFHALWIVWVISGAFIARERRWLRNLHLGCVIGTLIVQAGGFCPLTTWEKDLQHLAGKSGYSGGFIEHYTAMFVYGDLVTLPQPAMLVGLALIAAGSLWVYLHRKLWAIV